MTVASYINIMFLMAVIVLSVEALQPTTVGYDNVTPVTDCLSIIQNIHGLQFDLDASSKRIRDLKGKLDSDTNTETAKESELVERSAALKQSRAIYEGDTRLASSTNNNLRSAESNVTNLTKQINLQASIVHSQEESIRNTSEIIDSLQSKGEKSESESRKLELSLQMLINDLDTSNKTLADSNAGLVQRRLEVSSLAVSVQQLTANSSAQSVLLNSLEKDNSGTSSSLDKMRRDLADAEQAHFVEEKRLDSTKRALAQQKTGLENARIDRDARYHELLIYTNSTMRDMSAHLKKLQIEKARISHELAANQAIVSQSMSTNGSTSTNTESSTFVGVDQDMLRKSIRESKMLLAREGYADRLSFAQLQPDRTTGSTDVDTAIESLRVRSKILSLKEELRDRSEESFTLDAGLKVAQGKADSLKNDYMAANATVVRDEIRLNLLMSIVQNTTDSVKSLDTVVEQYKPRIANLAAIDAAQKQKIADLRSSLSNTHSILVHARASLASSTGLLASATNDKDKKIENLKRMKQEQIDTIQKIKVMDKISADLTSQLALEHQRLELLHENMTQSAAQLEETRRVHMEALAEAAQLTRRLEEKTQHVQESDSELKTEEETIRQLESNIGLILEDRSEVNDKLNSETSVSDAIRKKLDILQSQAVRGKCNQ